MAFQPPSIVCVVVVTLNTFRILEKIFFLVITSLSRVPSNYFVVNTSNYVLCKFDSVLAMRFYYVKQIRFRNVMKLYLSLWSLRKKSRDEKIFRIERAGCGRWNRTTKSIYRQ